MGVLGDLSVALILLCSFMTETGAVATSDNFLGNVYLFIVKSAAVIFVVYRDDTFYMHTR